MSAKPRRKGSSYDILSERKWLVYLAGLCDSPSILYNIYRLLIISSIVYIAAMTVLTCILVPVRQVIISSVHSLANQMYIIFMFFAVTFLLQRSLEDTGTALRSGVFHYEDEEEDKELMIMKESLPKEIRRTSNIFICMFVSSGINSLILLPLAQMLLDPSHSSAVENPFQPNSEDETLLGTVIGWSIGAVIMFYIYAITCAVNWYYVNGVVQLKVHFRILNHSIANIQRRALSIYTKKRSIPISVNPEMLFGDDFFQSCLYMSFRSNVQHHQSLLRLKKIFQPFSGSFTLCVFILAPFAYGCLLYLLCQVNPVNVTINLCLTFVAEQFTVIFICFLGQDLYIESEEVFERLYSIDWYNYNKKFKQILHIMMTNSLRPAGIQALIFGMPASLQTYGNVMSAMYKVTSLARESDLVK